MKNHSSNLKIFKILVVGFAFSFLVFGLPLAHAQLTLAPRCNATLPPNSPSGGTPETTPCDIPAFITWIRQVIKFLLTVAIPLGIVFITWGGFVIMTAGGSEEKVKKGKDIVLASVIGIAIALAAWLIVITVDKILKGGI